MLIMKRFISGSKISNLWLIQTEIIEGQDFGFFQVRIYKNKNLRKVRNAKVLKTLNR